MDRALSLRLGRPDLAYGADLNGTNIISSPVAMGRNTNAAQAGMDDVPASTGILGLSMLSVLVLGVMGFYIATRSRQF